MTNIKGETVADPVETNIANEKLCHSKHEMKENLPLRSSLSKTVTKMNNDINSDKKRSPESSAQPTILSMFNRKRKVSETSEKMPLSDTSNNGNENESSSQDRNFIPKKLKSEVKRCHNCFQLHDQADLKFYEGHPPEAVPEYDAMFHKNVTLIEFEGLEQEVERAQFKITEFSVFCASSHLCPFDTGLIEKNIKLNFSGYMKCIIDESPCCESGVAMYSASPIVEWWISGYDGSQKSLIGFSTECADYYLIKPSHEYASVMQPLYEKAAMCKAVVEYLLDNCDLDPTYEDMLSHLKSCLPPDGHEPYTEDSILRHAQFICDQVASIDECEPNEVPLVTLRCIRKLINLVGIKLTKSVTRKSEKSIVSRKKIFSKATTTALVKEIFESFFPEQLDMDNKYHPRRRRCGVCDPCQKPDCGKCSACSAMIKFGGSGKTKKACHSRICPNMTVQEAEESDPEDEELYSEKSEAIKNVPIKNSDYTVFNTKSDKSNVEWIGNGTNDVDADRIYYNSCQVHGVQYEIGDFVLLEPENSSHESAVAQIMYLFGSGKRKFFHAQFFVRGSDTILAEVSHPKELFITDTCKPLELFMISKKASVEYKLAPKNWATLGGFKEPDQEFHENSFFFQKRYEEKYARFEDPDPLINDQYRSPPWQGYCPSCTFAKEKLEHDIPQLDDYASKIKWRGQTFCCGDAILIHSGKYDLISYDGDDEKKEAAPKIEKVDDMEYPEYYRKGDGDSRGTNIHTPKPFSLGYITEIYTKIKSLDKPEIWVKVFKMYRPENIPSGSHTIKDLNMVYWSYEELDINFFECVAGKCYLMYAGATEISTDKWTSQGPQRFYFKEIWDSKEEVIKPVSGGVAASVGSSGKGKRGAKGKGKVKSSVKDKVSADFPVYPEVNTLLRTLDVFAGCGGLSEGLHQAGVSKSEWAIEFDKSAAAAYKLNNPDAIVFNEDCNHILKSAMEGNTHTASNLRIPLQGEVELLCGGPPCQGFSGMNRFNKLEYSLFKNSLVATYLSYCDFYRPRFFILENVRNFVAFKSGMVLKLTLRCLTAMGYQCTFGILQAGNYGVPQTRRRLIILAAAPGEKLPMYPEPSHVFSRRQSGLSVTVDGKKYVSNMFWEEQAPYRTITIKDAMSDLPPISSGNTCVVQDYDSIPQSHFQRKMRSQELEMLYDHITKDQSALVQARISLIPTTVGADWRDLPNRIMKLSDGKLCELLRYSYEDKKNGRSPSGLKRGVCACASKKPCNSYDRQFNTLIPWCLPHTANRHNNWAGLYGRLNWDGYFSTTVTNPEPMGKQGRVLHPDQHRVVSVRECARSQGFPDCYKFYGHIIEKHRQVGNAVPPPMAHAIGMEIRKCLS